MQFNAETTSIIVQYSITYCNLKGILYSYMNDRIETSHPEAVVNGARDFKEINLRKVLLALPSYHQHISCPTRGGNTLDYVYTHSREG